MIQILLATYNSAPFLKIQLDSLMNQSYRDFEILVNDGASRDNTLAIIADYQKRYPGKIRLLGSAPVSACKNFSILLAAADAELIMFCDHNDVWKKEKIVEHTYANQNLFSVFVSS
ncbi:MAG: glycosyltransferase [Lentisphaerae bacterium]|nr:glycosyltransferase [Lentisphaerota bacterium]